MPIIPPGDTFEYRAKLLTNALTMGLTLHETFKPITLRTPLSR